MATTDKGLVDLPGQLSKQLQHPVRMMSTFKITGIDMAVTGSGPGAVSGVLKYFSPTRGRVAALKEAWQACKTIMDAQGIRYWNNLNYDFRPSFRTPAHFTLEGALGTSFLNQASIEQIAGVNVPLSLITPVAGSQSVFGAYNDSIEPNQLIAPNFSAGFATLGAGTAGDMVLNEGIYLVSRVPEANEVPEEIPFQCSYNDTTDIASPVWMWRPDPVQYLSVLTGQFEISIDDSTEPLLDADMTFHVAGWKSILGNKKRRSSKKGGKKHGRKRTTRKSRK